MSEHLMNPEPSAPSFGERRGHRLAPLNTKLNQPIATPTTTKPPPNPRIQQTRPRPNDYPSTNGTEGPVPLQSPGPVRRQSSKSSLRSLFSRDKSARVAAVAPDNKLTEIEESQPPTAPIPVPDMPLSPSITSPITEPTTPTTITSPTTPRARATLKTSRPRPAETNPTPSKEQYGWKPPPLFQAYPQSYKHECLPAPAMSADSILRLHATVGRSATEDSRNGAQDQAKKREQKERKHLRTLSGTINKVEWTQKIYVLATAGYILQYAGEGKHDRLPESMLQLGPKSVAFASDAIPGKHWVVQVSQNSAVDPTAESAEPSKTKFTSRFGFHRSGPRRLARSFLMVFDNPDSMISWLMAIRSEIESRGGPKFTTEKHSDDDEVPHQLRSKSSVRQMVKKDPHRISSLFLQPQPLQPPDEDEDGHSVGGLTWQSRRSSYVSVSRRSMIDSRAGSTSTGTDGASSSFTSENPPAMPPMNNGAAVLEELSKTAVDPAYTRSPPSSSQGKRQSLYGSPHSQAISTSSRPEVPEHHVQTSIPEGLVRCASPPAPNFSVPSFSKKFTPRQGTSISQTTSPPLSGPGPGTLRREESTGNFSISNISSPPQSPTYSIASSRQTDLSETLGPRDGRRLRASNSEDALSRTVRSAHGTPFARVPRPGPGAPETSPPSSRPLSLVGRTGLGITTDLQASHTIAPERIRIPPLQPDGPMNMNMSRRKSMPGISLGPPSAPPPNCPLPKIPSPLTAQPPAPWATSPPAPSDRFYQSQQVREHVKDRRRSGLPPISPQSSKFGKGQGMI